MSQMDSLEKYRQKRNFKRTSEPYGEERQPRPFTRPEAGKKSEAAPVFVVQKHSASSLHYDFRLEIDGVLVSWAVPKGPSMDPQIKRLAVRTEDHPLEYVDFEGRIPAGEYGAGTVIVWDTGTFHNLGEKDGRETPLKEALEKGHLAFWLEGLKLKGGYALTKFGKGKQWLLVKMKDEKASALRDPVISEPRSVLSGRTLEDFGVR